MRLHQFVEWFQHHPRQSYSSMKASLELGHSSQVESFLSRIEFSAERGPCPLIGRANVQLYTFVAMPSVPKLSIKTIRGRRYSMPAQTRETSDQCCQLIHQPTVEPCRFPAMCHACKKERKHLFERVAVVGKTAIVRAKCGKCGKETTK